MSVLFRRVVGCSVLVLMFPLVSESAEKSRVGLEKMKLASSVGAKCSGFYDGVFALLHNLDQAADHQALGVIQKNWPGINKRYLFRQSTSTMLMTGIFIKQMNQKFTLKESFSFQSFSQDYVLSRKSAMAWKDGKTDNEEQKRQHQQCEHILQITKNNGTLSDRVINAAMQKRSVALGVDLKSMD
ncbi:hypothetical protein [Neptunomonas japonica]|uniref:Uncharacterized protein n=1 Tax=Neptunomonas japonica JAMM 1380 TaxID=1441457 RepID=A0A7R6PA63_9GAMM|nr:hypothetical protein [Neptunomonas japonica]BBB30078.1 hypothetical protein NEJAP_2130 [Neptunomonas japonica JAMM 1380]